MQKTRSSKSSSCRRHRRGLGAALSLAGLLGALLPALAMGHESGFTTLHVQVEEARLTGTWELTTVDALILLRPTAAASAELPKARPLSPEEIERLGRHLAAVLGIESDAVPCAIEIEGEVPAAGAALPGARESVAIALAAVCAEPIRTLGIHYPILFDLDPKHRGFYSVQDFRGYQAGVFTVDSQSATVDVHQFSLRDTALEYAREGVWHISTGLDHLLFLIALLLPSVLPRKDVAPGTEEGFRVVASRVFWIVTAFTIAHSITLSLAFLGALRLPARPVEIAIAASVFVAAWNNVRPFLSSRHGGAWMAFGFGLIHGLGFAGALSQLGLPARGRVLGLFSFNIGVEAGQLAIVLVLLPVIYHVRGSSAYARWGVRAGSLFISWLAVVWMVERALGVDLIAWL